MALSTAVQDELRAELAAIETLRKQMNERLDARARVLREVLEPFDVAQATLPFAVSVTPAIRSDSAVDGIVAGSNDTITLLQSKFAANGLRAAAVDALQRHGPMRAPAIARILESAGYQNDAKTPLATRIYNDLWRLIEPGIIENNDGVFKLKEGH